MIIVLSDRQYYLAGAAISVFEGIATLLTLAYYRPQWRYEFAIWQSMQEFLKIETDGSV